MVKHFYVFVAALAALFVPVGQAQAASPMLSLAAALLGTAGTPDAGNSTLAGNIASLVADNSSMVTFTTAVNDSAGNPVSGQTVSITGTGTGNTFGVTSGKTDASGLFVTTLKSTKAEAKVVTASVGGLSLTANVTFRAGALSSSTSTLLANPNTNLVADGNTTTTFTTALRDAQRNPIANTNVTFSVTGGNNTVGALTGTTDANGLFTTTLKTITAELKKASLVAGSVTLTDSITFVAGSPNAATTTFVVSPNANITADNLTPATITITARDAFHNLVSGQAATVSATGTGNVLGLASGTTNTQGVFSTTLKSRVAETKVLSLAVGALTQSANVVFVPGAPKIPNTTVVASPNAVVADQNTTVTVTGTALDGTNNPLYNQTVTLTVSGSNNVVTTASGTTDANGVFHSSFTSTKAELKVVGFRVGSALATTNVVYTAGSPNLTTSTFLVNPNNNVVANNASVATFTTTLRDEFGNPVINKSLNLASTGTGNTFSASNGNTNSSGIFISQLKTTVAQPKVVTLSGSLTGSANVTFVPGPASGTTSSFTASPNVNVLANNSNAVTLTATLFDAQNNVLANQNVTLSVTGGNNTLAAKTGATDANGVFTTTLTSSHAETKTITLIAGATAVKTTATFVPGVATSANTTLLASPSNVVANNSTLMTLTGTVRDAFGNPIGNQTISLASTGGNNTLSATSGSTNAAGVFTATLKTSKAEAKSLTFTAGSAVANANVNFVPGLGSTADSLLVSDINTTLVANNQNAFTLTATILDASKNPLVNQAVNVSSTGSLNTFSHTSGTTDANGVFSTEIRSSHAEAKTVTFKASAASPNIVVTFVAGSPNQAATTLVASPASVLADGSATTKLVATVRDSFKNPIANQAVTLASSGNDNTLGAASGNTTLTGEFNTTLSSVLAETKVISLTTAGFTVNANVVFTAGIPSSANTTFTASPNTLTADNNARVTLSATIYDAVHNPIPKQSVSLKATGTGNSFAASGGSTDANGLFTTYLKSSVAQTKTLTMTAGTVAINQNVTFQPGPVSATTSTVVATPASGVTADNANVTSVAVTLLDSQKNPVPNTAVTLAISNGNSTFASAGGNVDANGLFTTTLHSSAAGVQRITATATASGVVITGNVTFAAGSPNATNSTFTASPNAALTANGAAASTLTSTLNDAFGNPVPGQAVTLTVDGNSNVLGLSSGKTDLTGKFTTTLKSTKAQSKHIALTAGSLTQSANVVFVVGAPASGTSTLVATPNSVLANNSNTATLVATVRDASGNLIDNQTIALTVSGNNTTVTAPTGTTDANGVFTTTVSSSKSELKVVTLTAGTATVKTNVLFTAGSPNATNSNFLLSPNATVVADNTAALTLTAKIEDNFGNPVAGQAVTFSTTGSDNTLAAATGNTSAAGTFVTTLKSSKAETKVLTMTAGSLVMTQNVTFVAGKPSLATSQLTLSPNAGLMVDTNATTTVSVLLRDVYNNIVANQNVVFTSTGSDNTFAAGAGATNANGVYSTTLTSHHAEVKTLALTTVGAVLKSDVTFAAGSPNSTASTVIINPLSVTADNAATATVTTTARDQYNNLIGNYAVSLAATGGNTTLAAASGNTTAAGVFVTTLKSTQASLKHVTATIGSAAASGNVVFVAGPANANTSVIVASPNSLVADNSNTSTVSLAAKDVQGNPLVDTLVSVSSSGTGTVLTPTTGRTDASGNFNVAVHASKAEAKVVSFKLGAVILNTNLTFVAGSPNQKTSTLVAAPLTVVADGNTTSTLTVTLRDATNNPVAATAVSISSTGGNNTLASAGGNTNPNGVFTTTLASITAQTKVVTVTAAGVSLSANVVFAAGQPNQTLSTLAVSPNTTLANNSNTLSLTATLLDALHNPVPNQSVALSANGTFNVFTPASGRTNDSGIFASLMKSSKAEAKTVTMTAGPVTDTLSVSFTPGAPSSVRSTLVASPNTKVTADNNSVYTLTATVLDGTGNMLAAQPVTLAVSGTGGTLASSGGNTDANGIFTTTLKSTKSEVKVVTLAAGSMSLSANVTFVAGSPNATSTTFVINPNVNVAANNTSLATLTGTVIDDFNNLVSGAPVTLNANGTGNAFSLMQGTTNTTGVFTSTLRSTVAETKAVTFHLGNLNITHAAGFVPGPASPVVSTVILSPNSVVADGNTTMTLTAVLRDSYNNLIANQNYTLAVSGSNNTLSTGFASGTTNGNGLLSASFQSTTAESKKVTITAGGVVFTTIGTVLAGSPNVTASSFVASPNTNVVADYATNATVTATLVDAFHNACANQNVRITSTGDGVAISPASGNTTTTGSFVAKVKSSTTGSQTITFKSGSSTLTTTVGFVAGAASSTASNLVATPRVGANADGSSTVTLAGSVADALDNPVANASVTLTSSVASDVFGATTGTTDPNGNFSTTLKATVGGTRTVTLKSGAATTSTTVVFNSNATAMLQQTGTPSLWAFADTLAGAGWNVEALAARQDVAQASAVTVADFNGDGTADVALISASMGTARLLLNDGTGHVGAEHSYAALSTPVAATTGDIDGDGFVDLIVANDADATVSVYYGQGDGTLEAPRKRAGVAHPTSIACADFSGNGRQDLALVSGESGTVSVLENVGTGYFAPGEVLVATGPVLRVVARDFNADGTVDLATASNDDVVDVFVSRGEAGFDAPVSYNVGEATCSLAAKAAQAEGASCSAEPETAGCVEALFGPASLAQLDGARALQP